LSHNEGSVGDHVVPQFLSFVDYGITQLLDWCVLDLHSILSWINSTQPSPYFHYQVGQGLSQ